jgi:glycosyltransferase involved in cell wall biosynthesis
MWNFGSEPRGDFLTGPELSFVIPMMNEADCLDRLFARLHAAIAEVEAEYEIVCVNDGSTDTTLERLKDLQRLDRRIRIIDLSRNFGKEAALTAGLHNARGRCVIPLDADLQDPPELIKTLVAKWREGYEVVNAVRVARDTDTFAKRVTAGGFYWLVNHISDIQIPVNSGDFRLMDRKVVEALKGLPERSRFNKGLFAWVGFRQTTVEYVRPERVSGTTKFRYWKLWNFALDGITSFSSVPLRVWSYIGTMVASLGLLFATIVVVRTLIFGIDVPGYASTIVIILFFSGLNMLSLGIVGEYIARIYVESKQRPLYIIREVHEPTPAVGQGKPDQSFPAEIAQSNR